MYVMLTMFCFAVLLVAMRSFRDGKWTWKGSFIPTAILCCLGFLTHYYFIMFVFFVAAFTCLYLVFHKETRAKAFIYGGSVCVGLVAAVLYYPACLSHIFSGYRGTEATQAFADVSNTFGRINFFVEMLNDFTFSGAFYALALIALLLYMFCGYKKKTAGTGGKLTPAQWLLIVVTICFFLLVCKTGMMPSNPAEALRYASPSYGLIILLVVMAIVSAFNRVGLKPVFAIVVLSATALCQVYGLFSDKVFFVYPDAVNNYAWAREHSDKDIVYIYNPNNAWMIWNDSPELMEYSRIYFIPYTDENEISDELLKSSDSVVVYSCRCDESEQIMGRILDANEKLSSFEKTAERLYVDIYELK